MTEQERLNGFKLAVEQASREFGVQIGIIGQVGNVVLHEPTLGYIVLPETPAPVETEQPEPALNPEELRAALERAHHLTSDTVLEG